MREYAGASCGGLAGADCLDHLYCDGCALTYGPANGYGLGGIHGTGDVVDTRCIYMVNEPCVSLCRHRGGQAASGCVCPWAERQDVADNGPGPFVPETPAQRPGSLGARPGIDWTPGEPGMTPIRAKNPRDAAPQTPPPDGIPLDPGEPEAPELDNASVDRLMAAFWYELDWPNALAGDAPVGEFGRAAARTLDEVRETFDTRGNTYGDTWALDDWLSEHARIRDCKALVRVKMRRAEMTGYTHRDSLVDLIAYAAAYVTWADELGAWE